MSGPRRLWLDHTALGEADLKQMAPVELLALWNVKLPDGFLARLPNLVGLSVRGGSGSALELVEGCDSLLMLDINQIRGLHDLSEIAGLSSLEFLSLYGLPRIEELPDLRALERLRHVQLGSMKGLKTLAGLASIPKLKTLQFARAVSISQRDVEMLAEHPTLEAFDWFAEDVPLRVARPVVERLSHMGKPRPIRPEDWLEKRLSSRA